MFIVYTISLIVSSAMTFLLGHSDHELDHSHRDSNNHDEGNDKVR